MLLASGKYTLKVASAGDGGGGEFSLLGTEPKLKELAIDERSNGDIIAGATEFWSFKGLEGQTVYLSVRTRTFEPIISVRNPDGIPMIIDDRGKPGIGSVVPIYLPKSGHYSIWVSAKKGSGNFTIRIINAD